MRVCPQAAPAASGNLGFCPFRVEVKKHGFQTAWLITGQKFQEVGLKLKAFILTSRDPSSHLCQKNMRVAEIEISKWESGSRICSFYHFVLREFEKRDPDIFPNLKFPKLHVPSIQNELILS